MIESITHNNIEEKIDQYVNGQLSEKEIEALWTKLIQDEYHLEYLKSVANVKELLNISRKKRKAAKVRRNYSYTAAALIIILVTVFSVFTIPGLNNSDALKPITNIELDYYRSVDGAVLSNAEDKRIISNAIALANTGKFEQAITLLNNELAQATKPQWIAELNLNLGSLHYNEGNYVQSAEYFNNVISHKDSIDILALEKAYWYLGNAYFQLDYLDKAQEKIRAAYDLNGAYRRVAKSYLDALSKANP